jgi:protein involved in ribonucleotide reduction
MAVRVASVAVLFSLIAVSSLSRKTAHFVRELNIPVWKVKTAEKSDRKTDGVFKFYKR